MNTEDKDAVYFLEDALEETFKNQSEELAREFTKLIKKYVKIEVLDNEHIKLTCEKNKNDEDALFYTMLLLACFYPTPDKNSITLQMLNTKYDEKSEVISVVIPNYATALQDAKDYVKDCVEAGDDINEVTGDIPTWLMQEVAKELGMKLNH